MLMAGAGGGYTVRLWDAATGKDIRTFAGHGGPVHSIAFDPTGKMLASGGGDTIRLWDVETGREEARMNTRFPYELVFSPNGKFLFSSSTKDVRVWNVAERKEIRTLGASKGALVFSLAVSPDSKYLAAQSHEGPTHVWEIETGKTLHLPKANHTVLAIPFFLADGKTLAEVHEERVIYYDVPTVRELRRLPCGGYPAVLSPDEKVLATSKLPGARPGILLPDRVPIDLWDTATGKKLRELRGHFDGVYHLAFSPDSKRLVSGGGDHIPRVWDVATGTELSPTEGHQSAVTSVAFSADGKLLLSASNDRTIRLWEPLSGRQIQRIEMGREVPIGAGFLSDQRSLVAPCTSPAPPQNGIPSEPVRNRVRILDWATGKELRSFEVHREFPCAAAFSSGSQMLAVAGDRYVTVWDVVSGKEVSRLDNQYWEGTALALSADGKQLAIATGNIEGRLRTSLRMVSSASGEKSWESKGWFHVYGAVALSPNGKYLVSATTPRREGGPPLALWDCATGKSIRAMEGSLGPLAFSPDGRIFANAGDDGTLAVWEVATCRKRCQFAGHQRVTRPLFSPAISDGAILALAFSPDGRLLASAGTDAQILVWNVTGRLLDGHLARLELTKKQLDSAWVALAEEDPSKAHRAIWQLVSAPTQTVAYMKQRLPIAPAAEVQRFARWIGDLDSDAFPIREKAMLELERLGQAAIPHLRRALGQRTSAEMRWRLERLLAKEKPEDPTRDAELRRGLRIVEVLEHIGTSEAKKALELLAERAGSTLVIQDTQETMDRLAKGNIKAP
jgi:WD40 repeat protein